MTATLSLSEAAGSSWDAVVIGAGPSGALAASQLARDGASVLLVDRAAFPRPKVCGCCLNAAAVGILRSVGLGALPSQHGARPLRALQLLEHRRSVRLEVSPGFSISREVLDAALISHAVHAGAAFLPQTTATLPDDTRHLRLRRETQACLVESRIILVATGLGGLGGAQTGARPEPVRGSRVGVGTTLERAPDWHEGGTVVMACARGGYVGLVELEDGRLNVAAALDAEFIRAEHGPGPAAIRILEDAGAPHLDGLAEAQWRGTPRLTHHGLRLVRERCFVLGDAAGYVEPFTGEGMAWALWCGAAVAPFATAAMRRWTPALAAQWKRLYRQRIHRRQRTCRGLAFLLRQPAARRLMMRALSRMPSLAGPLLRSVNAPLPIA